VGRGEGEKRRRGEEEKGRGGNRYSVTGKIHHGFHGEHGEEHGRNLKI
jgi:hypothetical protein